MAEDRLTGLRRALASAGKIEAERVRGYVTFFNERVDVDLDGERQPRAESEWTESAVVALPSAD